jgi:3-hydroxyisobutyrate dehydrogenase-like beta-hydroxyacid dehydrogenase
MDMKIDGKDPQRICMIGFGEAARAFVSGWALADRVSAYDIKLRDASQASAMADACRSAGVDGHAEPGAALRDASLVFCLVTADQVLDATSAAAPHLSPGAFWFDGNSCAPGTKRAAARLVAEAGGNYVDVAIMAPVHPKLHETPLLLSGEAAEQGSSLLAELGMHPEMTGGGVGSASAIKMIRSVMIKGFEALTAECLLAARRAGVEDRVMASLQSSDPSFDWPARTAYNLDRMMVHGSRRAAEMREVAATLRELSLPDRMAAATATWEEEIGSLKLETGKASFVERADRILAARQAAADDRPTDATPA